MDILHPLALIGYVLQERHSKHYLHDDSGLIDREWYGALQSSLMSEVIRGVDGQAEGRNVVERCRGKQTLFSVSISRVLVDHPVSPSLKRRTGQLCFMGYHVEADASLNATGETLLSLRLLIDPQVKRIVLEHGGLILTVKDGDDTVIAVTPLVSLEVLSKHFGTDQTVVQEKVDLSKLS